MADDSSKKVKIIVVVLCFAGAAAGLWFAFGPSGTPTYTTGSEGMNTEQGDGAPDLPPEELREVTSGA